ncbi:MAG: glutamyl-tRNA reductase [Bacillota bacterium]
MLGIGETIEIEIREKFIIPQRQLKDSLVNLQSIFEEVVILSTCNRTEVYINNEMGKSELIEKVFNTLRWDTLYNDYTYQFEGEDAVNHLMEVACGFHSKILGEDQILGQVRIAFENAKDSGLLNGKLHRLFQNAIACGKEFKHKSRLNEIPVSSSSIAVKIAKEKGISRFMIIGYGEVGQLALKYIGTGDGSYAYIARRNLPSFIEQGENFKFIDFREIKKYYQEVDCIISCTSAPHNVIYKEDLPSKDYLIFDLAVPRDVHNDVELLENVKVYDIDIIDNLDRDNRRKRENILLRHKYIPAKYTEEYLKWIDSREICVKIKEIQEYGDEVYKKRYETYKHKKDSKDDEELVQMLLKSTSKAFVNRAIKVLKEENQKGSGEECLRILERIFCPQE